MLYPGHKEDVMKRIDLKNYWIAAGFALTITLFHPGIATAAEPEVVAEKMVTTVKGSEIVVPATGTPGCTTLYNYRPYNVPGEAVKETVNPCEIINLPYEIAYDENCAKPVQTSDWWSGVGLQWSGWAFGYDPTNPAVRTQGFINEPFQYQFVDLPDSKKVAGLDLPVQGLRLWNQYHIDVKTHPDKPGTNIFCRGPVRGPESPIVTVGLEGVHPINSDTGGNAPTSSPWTNIKIKNYSDWGVVMTYKNKNGDDITSELTVTMANGSPFTWFERTAGHAPFRVWAGAAASSKTDDFKVWNNDGTTLGLTVTTSYNSDSGDTKSPPPSSTAAYVVYADAGTWTEQKSTNTNEHMSLFKNEDATKVVVLAMPHNIYTTTALKAALTDLETYAWRKITDTRIHYPPIKGSETSHPASGKSLGYDEKKHVVRTMMEVTAEDFKHGGTLDPNLDPALQIVLPHHRKAMDLTDLDYIIKGDDGKPKYTWRSLVGELQAYEGNAYVRELQAYGVLPFLPSVAVNSASQVNGKVPADDIYDAMKEWFFFKGEPATAYISPFCRDQGYYLGYTANTYIYATAALFEGLGIADQLAQSSQLTGTDIDIKKSKNTVAAEMRDFILQRLKELIGQWADIYTSQWFQYNPTYHTVYGFPQGYLSVQNLCDKHFHWGYFLRSAAAIGRYDKTWLQNHMPLFEKLVADVASFDRGTSYPFLRNFSPFYGHSWADGIANGGPGNNQESTSEAINFAVGMIELGQILGNKDWRDIGMYLYEEEILGTQQYWFNQDADLENSSNEFYNGNWPDSFVHYNNTWINPIVGVISQRAVNRACFWGDKPYSDYVIHAVPLSASQLQMGRNQEWLTKAWEQFELDSTTETTSSGSPYEILLAGLQARLPGTGTNINDPGPIAALARINQKHPFYQAATNAMGKHWAYTNYQLGQIDITVTADTASYGVFKKSDGTRSYVAYNPGSTTVTVSFSDGAALTDIPAYAMAYKTGKNGTQTNDKIGKSTENKGRFYLRKPVSYTASCDALTPQNLSLATAPGTWKPLAGTTSFPTDTDSLADSIVCIPARSKQTTPTYEPDPKYIRTWKGTFSGKRVTTAPKDAFTRFAVYSNQSLFPGWQYDPATQGKDGVPSNVFVINIIYDFNGDGKDDRWEQYSISPIGGNSFAYQNKPTQHDFDQKVWPSFPSSGEPWDKPPMMLGGPSGTMKADFPSSVAYGKGKVTVKIWGGQLGDHQSYALPVPISVNAGPTTNRASWVQPPYDPHPHHR